MLGVKITASACHSHKTLFRNSAELIRSLCCYHYVMEIVLIFKRSFSRLFAQENFLFLLVFDMLGVKITVRNSDSHKTLVRNVVELTRSLSCHQRATAVVIIVSRSNQEYSLMRI